MGNKHVAFHGKTYHDLDIILTLAGGEGGSLGECLGNRNNVRAVDEIGLVVTEERKLLHDLSESVLDLGHVVLVVTLDPISLRYRQGNVVLTDHGLPFTGTP